MSTVRIHPSWEQKLRAEFEAPYFAELREFLREEKQKHKIYPPGHEIFAAFDETPFDQVKVVIIGQDPYHRPNQAHGLSFSVNRGISKPPSLSNIFKELHSDLGCPIPATGNLLHWARQGVLLLNAILTVREGQPGSHQQKGWERFTDSVIRLLSREKKGLVFLLWGRYAHGKEELIDSDRHFILKAAHPSPLARGAFFGCRHFSKANQLLVHQGIQPIQWEIPG